MTDDEARELLESERTRLLDALAMMRSELAVGPGEDAQDVSDGGALIADQAESSLVADQLKADLEGVEAALQRVALAMFGSCEVCHQPIGDERLRTIPSAMTCVAHQRERERGVGLSR